MERAQPVKRDELFLEICFGDIWFIVAGKLTHELAASIEDFESNGSSSGVRQIIIDDRAIRWICGRRLVGRKRRIGISIALHAVGGGWSEKMIFGGGERTG